MADDTVSFDMINEMFASEMLFSSGNSYTLNGLTSDAFLRRDIDTGPKGNEIVTLGYETERFKNIWTKEINGIDCTHILYNHKHNIPDINSVLNTDDGTYNGFDFGQKNMYWRNGFFRNFNVDNLSVKNIYMGDGKTPLSHNKLGDIGTTSHVDIDAHIANNKNPHGATSQSIANTIVMRDASRNINCNQLNGVALKAKYADLAEMYTCKENGREYVGKVFSVSSDKRYDVELCNEELSNKVVGIVSENPSYLMNSEIKGMPIALKGIVRAYVIGKVKKGDILVTTKNGNLRKAKDWEEIYKIAYANEDKEQKELALITCIL